MPEVAAASPSKESAGSGEMRQRALSTFASGHKDLFSRNTVERQGRERDVVAKVTCETECSTYRELMADEALRPLVPELFDITHAPLVEGAPVAADKAFAVHLEDVTAGCQAPCVMDIKLGTRTFLETDAGQNKPRKDLLAKLDEFAPHEATPEEQSQGLTKLRYLSLRDQYSTSSTHGFRVDGIDLSDKRARRPDGPALPVPAKLRSLHSDAALDEALRSFFDACGFGADLRAIFAARVVAMRATMDASPWIAHHECIATSLLFVYDGVSKEAARESADVHWIDFTKVIKVEEPLSHRAEWVPGTQSHEDGLLRGMDGIIDKLATQQPAES